MLASQRIIFNTSIMYAKTVLTLGITLYSTRIILNELGENDFGIYNVVAGVIAMLSFLTHAMSQSTRRYMSNAIGKKDIELLAIIFKSSIKIHLIWGCAFVLLLEVLGVFLFNGFLNIPPHRLSTAYFVFHCMVASTFCSITVIPYAAAINSHEDIFVISIIYTLESFAKLGIAFYLQYTLHDKLIVYGLLLATIYCIATLIYRWYCHTHYKEIHIKIKTNKDTTKELVKFSFWTVIGNASRIISTQGSTILLNLFGGTVANAAYGIANQVNGQMSFFSASLLQAIEPQIMKSEGNNDTHRMKRLSLLTCKLSFFLISFFSIPIFCKMPYILNLWLKDVPEYTVIFCRIILLTALMSQITMGLQSGIYAKGRIRNYQLVMSIIQLLSLPLAFILLKAGFPVEIILYSLLMVETAMGISRIILAKHLIHIKIAILIKEMLLPSLAACIATFIAVNYSSSLFMTDSIFTFLMLCLESFLVYSCLFWIIVLNKNEKQSFVKLLKNYSFLKNEVVHKHNFCTKKENTKNI